MNIVLLVCFLFFASPAWGEGQPFAVHTLAEGETLSAIAGRYGAAQGDIASANGLADGERLPPPGTVMLIPGSPEHVLSTLYEAKRRGLGAWPQPRYPGEFLAPLSALPAAPSPKGTGSGSQRSVPAEQQAGMPVPAETGPAPGSAYTVKAGDTLYRIGKNAGVPLEDLLKANNLTADSVIRPGDVLVLSGTAARPAKEKKPEEQKIGVPVSGSGSSPFSWPLRGGTAREKRVSRGAGLFEPAAAGTAVFAPASGTVLHGGWMKEYGNAVFIRHGEEFATFCGGLGIIYVKPGQSVTVETKIGLVGEGSGPGLTFHLLRKGKTVDPAPYLGPSTVP